MAHSIMSFERALSDSQMKAKKAFLETHYKRFAAWDRWDLPGFCEYLSDDITFTLGNMEATGIEAVSRLLNKCKDALNNDPFDGFRHETIFVEFTSITDKCIKADIFLDIWQRLKATGEWKQQLFNKLIDEQTHPGHFTILVTSEERDGKWLVTEQLTTSDDENTLWTI